MFIYEKKLQFPVKIATPNPKLASFIISQYGGPDGELGASMRYLSQRYAMPYDEAKGLLTDIGTYGSKWNHCRTQKAPGILARMPGAFECSIFKRVSHRNMRNPVFQKVLSGLHEPHILIQRTRIGLCPNVDAFCMKFLFRNRNTGLYDLSTNPTAALHGYHPTNGNFIVSRPLGQNPQICLYSIVIF